MLVLKPIIDKACYSRAIERKIKSFLHALIFKDIEKIISDSVSNCYNSKDDDDLKDLLEAIRKGKIQFYDGKFSGKFNAKISRALFNLGAKFSSRTKTWNIKNKDIPVDIQASIASANIRFKKLYDDVLDKLSNINVDEAIKIFSFATDYETTLTDLDKQLYQTALKDISIIPEFTPTMLKNIANDYSNNLKLYIKNFANDEILKLRDLVYRNTFEGGRASALVDIIESRYKVSESKARFLAKQESSLLVSKFREQRYKDCGITSYKWLTSNDERVREDHKLLDGQIYSFDSPPVTNRRTGAKNNPGEDFNCRCIAAGIVEF